jgi:hypothetical protein
MMGAGPPPPFWHIVLLRLFAVQDKRLRDQIWRHYPASMELRWQLDICGQPAMSPDAALQRVKKLSQLLSPQTLLRCAERIAPSGRPRPKAIREFERRVLDIVDKNGKFIWMKED